MISGRFGEMEEARRKVSDPELPPQSSVETTRARSGFLHLVIAWAIARTIIWIIATTYGQIGRPHRAVKLPQSPADNLSSSNAMHYLHLAQHAYSTGRKEGPPLNLFPVFPAITYPI